MTVMTVNNSLCIYVIAETAHTDSAPKPTIDGTLAQGVYVNGTFVLNCSVEYDPGVLIQLDWSVPNRRGEITVSRTSNYHN